MNVVSTIYSKTPIYRGVWGKGNIRGKSGSALNRGFVWFTLSLCMFNPIWRKGNGLRYIGVCGKSGRGISGFYCIHYSHLHPPFTSYLQVMLYARHGLTITKTLIETCTSDTRKAFLVS